MVTFTKTYKVCRKCLKVTKHTIISPSPPHARTRLLKRNIHQLNTVVPQETQHLSGDIRVLAWTHFRDLLNKNRGDTRKNIPWANLSQTLALRRQHFVDWPANIPFCDGIKILKLSMIESRQLLGVKIQDWTMGMLSLYYTRIILINSIL